MAEIKFGTDGFRAIIAEDFTFETVEKIINATAKYIFDEFGLNKKIIIGYDPRFMADKFAKFSAEIFAKKGFEVLLSDKIIPTPVLAYNAQKLNASAVMFTASHNPPEYLGIKYIPDYAGPATDDITKKITDNIKNNISLKDAEKEKEYKLFDFKPDYYEHIEKLIDFKAIKNMDKHIIFDGLYSAAIGYFDEILDNHLIDYDAIHLYHTPNFEGCMPDPKPKYLTDLIEEVKMGKNAIGLSNDGDSDRFGVINENGEYVSPNEIICILLKHLIKNKNMTGSLVKTVGSSSMLDLTAKKLNINLIETAVGFKSVGEAMRLNDVIIGGEESGGLSIKGHIPEKDGILANLLILEVMAYEKKSLVELQQDLKNELKQDFYPDRIDLKLTDDATKNKFLDFYKNTVKSVGDNKVVKTNDIDGIKLYLEKDNSWILVRPSGTEPLLRIYFETNSKENLAKLRQDIEKINLI